VANVIHQLAAFPKLARGAHPQKTILYRIYYIYRKITTKGPAGPWKCRKA